MGEVLLTVLMIAVLWGGKFPRVGLCAVTGFAFWASYDTGRRVVALVTLVFLLAGLATGAFASTALGS